MTPKFISVFLLALPLALQALSPGQPQSLLQSIQTGLNEPATAERDARLEALVKSLDALPDATALAQKMSAHQRMANGYEKAENDAGLERHATWIVNAAKTCTPDQQKQFGSAIVTGYLSLAATWAANAQPDRALTLLRGAAAALPGLPNAARSVRSDIERLELVGTAAAPITAPRWLNMPAGSTSLDLKGQVTLVEFSAHWCIPCKKSYPAVNRLRQKYGPQGFRAVMATQLYGYFERETNMPPATELARDKTYFAEYHLDVPIAINDDASTSDDPNELHYKVIGLPQIVIADRKGIIRYITAGYTDSNEAAFARVIETLLK